MKEQRLTELFLELNQLTVAFLAAPEEKYTIDNIECLIDALNDVTIDIGSLARHIAIDRAKAVYPVEDTDATLATDIS